MYVCYVGYCSNCSEIIIDGVRKDYNETLCKRISDDLIIEAKFPKVFEVIYFSVRRNCSDGLPPKSCHYNLMTLKCNCSNLTAEHDGIYDYHIILNVLGIKTLELFSNKVTVIMRSKT